MTRSTKDTPSLWHRLSAGFSATLKTLTKKIQRDGLVRSLVAFAKICVAEQPFASIAHHLKVVGFFEQASMEPLKSRLISTKYFSPYLAKSLGKRARREVLL